MRAFFSQTIFMALWAVIYFLWHYVEESRNSQVGQLKLEATVRTLELKTIKSQLNPHFIFNALNSIRALVDENPRRARTAITELSNILRNSMQADKAETVSLENELSIVKDYLALENIRFEERLKVTVRHRPGNAGTACTAADAANPGGKRHQARHFWEVNGGLIPDRLACARYAPRDHHQEHRADRGRPERQRVLGLASTRAAPRVSCSAKELLRDL